MLVILKEMAELFGTDGIRGVANEYPMVPEMALRIGRATARVLKAEKVLIGRDTRVSSEMLEVAVMSGLLSEGAEVVLVGVMPTPAVARLIQETGCEAGVMITASHNPYTDNGIKIFGGDGHKLNDALEEEIEALILADDLPATSAQPGRSAVLEDAAERYTQFAKASIDHQSLEGFKVVLDGAHGAGYEMAPLILRELGAEVISLGDQPDGTNINEGFGSLHPEKAAAVVVQEGADLGVCLDGDADRVIFIDGDGTVLNGDRVLCFCAQSLHKAGKLRGDTFVSTVMSNLGLRDALAKAGIHLEMTAVGDRFVLERMQEVNSSLGGENSGHIIFSDFATTGDGIISALMVMSFMRESGQSLAELADCMDEYSQVMINMPVEKKPPLESVPEIVSAMKATEEVLGDAGRLLVRYSGTEKKLRVLVEARDEEFARSQCETIVAAAKRTIGS